MINLSEAIALFYSFRKVREKNSAVVDRAMN
jgi:hypothetical protein